MSHLDWIHALVVEVAPLEQHLALGPEARDKVVHAVETSDQRALPTTGRPDDGRNLAVGDTDIDVAQCLKVPVIDVEVPHLQVILHRRGIRGFHGYHSIAGGEVSKESA